MMYETGPIVVYIKVFEIRTGVSCEQGDEISLFYVDEFSLQHKILIPIIHSYKNISVIFYRTISKEDGVSPIQYSLRGNGFPHSHEIFIAKKITEYPRHVQEQYMEQLLTTVEV